MKLFLISIGINRLRYYGFTFVLLFIYNLDVFAQPANGVKSVDIISAFKPSVRKFSKFQFLPNLPSPDTSKLPLRYSIPTQAWQSEFVLKPVMPLAYQIDSNTAYNSLYIKAGYGNFKSATNCGEVPKLLFLLTITSFSGLMAKSTQGA